MAIVKTHPVTLTAYLRRGVPYDHIFFKWPQKWGNDYIDPLAGEFRRFSTAL